MSLIDNFKKYFFCRVFDSFGDNLQALILNLILASYTNSIFFAALVYSSHALIRIIISSFLINKINKFNVKKTMIFINILFIGIFILFFIIYTPNIRYICVFIIDFSFCFLFSIYKIVKTIMLKEIINKNKIKKSVSNIIIAENFISILIPFICGISIALISIKILIFINIFPFVLCLLILLFINDINFHTNKKSKLKTKNSLYTYITFLRKYKDLKYIILISIIATYLSSSFPLFMLKYLKETDILSYNIGIFQAVFYLGTILGSFIIRQIKEIKLFHSIRVASILLILCFIPYILNNNIFVFLFELLFIGIFFMYLNNIIQVYYQKAIDVLDIGYVKGLHTLCAGSTIIAAMFLNNFLFIYINISQLFILISIFLIILVLFTIKRKKGSDLYI